MFLLHNKGFTLIEIVIVIAIIGILAAIGIPQFSKFRRSSHNALAMSDLKNAITAQEAYYAQNKRYAGSLERIIDTRDLDISPKVEMIINGNESAYTITSHHPGGDKTYSYIGPGGKIISD